ncbi:MAG: hypothetical protein NWQ47_07715 [Crocinitomicaceae bacterium]|nr:hypothetical protein [Crocinitomicaceae bacterium]
MKTTLFIFAAILLASCGVKVPYTNEIRDEFGLDNEKAVKKVQFYTSATVIFERSKSSGNQGTSESGVLVTNSSKEQDRIIIPINTKCIFDSYGEDGELIIRFETGVNKTLTFMMRPNVQNSKFYLVADWTNPKGGKINYGNEEYTTTASSGNTYLNVVLKKLQKTKRKDRIVKGMKV